MNNVPTSEDIIQLAYRAGELVRDIYRDPESMGLEWKEDFSPLTAADQGVHRILVAFMAAKFPALPIIAEEGNVGERTGAEDEHWLLVDEVDGTWPFMLGIPLFTCMFTLMKGNSPVLCVIYDPIGDQLYHAVRGGGAFRNKVAFRIPTTLPKIPTIGFVSWPYQGKPSDMLVPGMLKKVVVGLHDMGCIPVNMVTGGYIDALVATGGLSATIFPGRTMHDTAPGHLLVEEAGGKATDLRGEPLVYGGPYVFGHIFSAGGAFHNELVALVKEGL